MLSKYIKTFLKRPKFDLHFRIHTWTPEVQYYFKHEDIMQIHNAFTDHILSYIDQ